MDYANKVRRMMEQKTPANLQGDQTSVQSQEIYSVIADARIRELRDSMNQTLPKLESRILHFSDGTLSVDELYDSEDEKEEVIPPIDAKTLNWLPWMWYQTLSAGATALKGADFLGEKLAYFFGITSPKYQLEIDERLAEIEEEKEEKLQMQQDMENWAGFRSIPDQKISRSFTEDDRVIRPLDAGDLPYNYSQELSVFSNQPLSENDSRPLPTASLHV